MNMFRNLIYKFFNWAEQDIVDVDKNPIPERKIQSVPYDFNDTKETGRLIKSQTNQEALFFPGMGDPFFRDERGNQIIYPRGGSTEKTNEFIFNLLATKKDITRIEAFSNGCNNAISALEYIIKIVNSNDNSEKSAKAKEILQRVNMINLSSPYVTIGNSYENNPWYFRFGRWFASFAEDENEETGFFSKTPISIRAAKVTAELKKYKRGDSAKILTIVSSSHDDLKCENFESYRQAEKDYCNKKGLQVQNMLKDIILIEIDKLGKNDVIGHNYIQSEMIIPGLAERENNYDNLKYSEQQFNWSDIKKIRQEVFNDNIRQTLQNATIENLKETKERFNKMKTVLNKVCNHTFYDMMPLSYKSSLWRLLWRLKSIDQVIISEMSRKILSQGAFQNRAAPSVSSENSFGLRNLFEEGSKSESSFGLDSLFKGAEQINSISPTVVAQSGEMTRSNSTKNLNSTIEQKRMISSNSLPNLRNEEMKQG